MASSDDEDLKRAIALSLDEAKSARHEEPIIISSDDDECITGAKNQDIPSSTAIAATSANDAGSTTGTSAFLTERAQLEAARIARVKRMRGLRSVDGPMSASSKENASSEGPFVSSDEESRPLSKKSKIYQATSTSVSTSDGQKSVQVQKQVEELFWSGELRQTANIQVEMSRDTRPIFRLHDILGKKSDLTFCILSSFVTQLSWIYSLLPPTVPVILVAQPGEGGAASVHNVLPNWVKVTPHLRGGRGCMHIKFMLLFYKTGRLRIVIQTANLADYDWRDIENSVWLQDIPRRLKSVEHISKGNRSDDFGRHFEKVLDAINVPEGLRALRMDHPEIPLGAVADLRQRWDFDKVTVKLVASLAGRHEGWPTVLDVGHTRLMRVVKDIGGFADPGDDTCSMFSGKGKGRAGSSKQGAQRTLQLECQTSSVGSYTSAWIDEFFTSARGASPEKWLDLPKTRRNKYIEERVNQKGWPRLKILFPSLRTVLASRLGTDGGGTMFCQRKQWNAAKFPRALFHDSNSKRGLVLMHTKMILATFEDPDASAQNNAKNSGKTTGKRRMPSPSPDSSETEFSNDSDVEEVNPERDEQVLGWLYVGSHNFTPSAWGTLSGSGFSPVMNIANYELGIVLPIRSPNQADELACWLRPPRKYELQEDEPWIQDVR